MTLAIQQIPLSKLIPSDLNVRRTNRDAGVKELAASIEAHGLIQNLTVRKVLKGKSKAVLFEVVAGGRRLAALKSLVKKKAIKKDDRVPCHVLNSGIAEELSLAENQHEPMHPADEYEAFAKLHSEHGMSAADIAARFGVTAAVVKQRMKLGAVSPKLMQAYRDEQINLDALMAFTLTDDHTRQEEVYEALPRANRYTVLQALTEGQVEADDRRAVFVGLEAYKKAGGSIVRDLFDEEGGGYLTDAALLDRLVREKLQSVASEIVAEGWKWVVVEAEFDYSRASSMRRIYPTALPLPEEDQARREALEARCEALAESEELSDEEEELGRIEAEIEALQPPEEYRAEDKAAAGVIVTLGHDGQPRIERGFVRPEDKAEAAIEKAEGVEAPAKPAISAALLAELSAYRTAGLRCDLAKAPELALIAVTHALVLQAFKFEADEASCLEISMKSANLGFVANGIEESEACRVMSERHEAWAKRLSRKGGDLWTLITALTMDELLSLLAHCASLSLDVVQRAGSRAGTRLDHAAALAKAMPHDMAPYWQPTAANYLSRVSREQMISAVKEGAGEEAARNIRDMKKAAMAANAEKLLAGKGWLPEVLR